MTEVQQNLQVVQDQAFDSIAMGKDPQLVVLLAIRDTVQVCLKHFSQEHEPNPNRKEVK